MDPIGSQKKIDGSQHNVSKQKNLDKKVGGLDGGFNTKSGTRKADNGKLESGWQGKVKGKITHTYGVDGQNDED